MRKPGPRVGCCLDSAQVFAFYVGVGVWKRLKDIFMLQPVFPGRYWSLKVANFCVLPSIGFDGIRGLTQLNHLRQFSLGRLENVRGAPSRLLCFRLQAVHRLPVLRCQKQSALWKPLKLGES